MLRRLVFSAVVTAAGALILLDTTGAQQPGTAPPPLPPGIKPAPEVPAMPKALMKLPRTGIHRFKFPAIDFHLHAGNLRTPEDYKKMIQLMDQANLAMICNMDGG